MTEHRDRKIGCHCDLNPIVLQRMVQDTLTRLYGHLEGRPYTVDDEALRILGSGAAGFIETMWTQVKDIMIRDNNRQIISKKDFELWRKKTGFKLRIKTSSGSLCRLFEQTKELRRRKKRNDY